MNPAQRKAALSANEVDYLMQAIKNDLAAAGHSDAAEYIWSKYKGSADAAGMKPGEPTTGESIERSRSEEQMRRNREQLTQHEKSMEQEKRRRDEREQYIKMRDDEDKAEAVKRRIEQEMGKLPAGEQAPAQAESEVKSGQEGGMHREAAQYSPADLQKHLQNLDDLTQSVMPNLSEDAQRNWSQWTDWARSQLSQLAQQPAAQTSPAPGVTAMFNSPENLQRIAELMSKVDSGHSIDEVMEEIRKSTGLDQKAFWAEIGKLSKTAADNPFAKKDDDKGEEKGESEDKAEESAEKEEGESESEEKEEKPEGEDNGGDDKPAEKSAPKKESKESEEDEEPGTPEWEKKDMKLAKDALKKLKELVKREKKEREGADVEKLERAMEIIEQLMKGEAEEAAAGGHDVPPSPEGEEVALEKTGPDLPPAMEGLALPLPEPSMEGGDGMKVIDLAPPAMPLMAGADERLSAESKKKLPPGFKPFPKKDDKGDKGDNKNPFAKKDEKKSGFSLNDRVWRKADFNSGFETVGDEPGRVVEFGNGMVIVDWGHDDGIPTEEKPDELMLAAAAAVEEHAMFAAPAPVAPDYADEDSGSAMGQAEEIDQVLRETSLYDILKKQAEADKREPDTVIHTASGKTAKILQRLASGQLRVAVDGKELTLWSYEVESN